MLTGRDAFPSCMMRIVAASGMFRASTKGFGKRRQLRKHAATNAWLAALAATFLTTAVYFVAIRKHNVDLSFDQLSNFERQKQAIGNHTAYFSEQLASADLLTTLSREDWTKISSKIDLVAFVFEDMYLYTTSKEWVREVSRAFARFEPPGFGIALFPCGCVVPNSLFTWSENRFRGFECAMLPGFVFPKEHVYWVNDTVSEGQCKGRESMHPKRWFEDNEWKLERARADFSNLREHLIKKRAEELAKAEAKAKGRK